MRDDAATVFVACTTGHLPPYWLSDDERGRMSRFVSNTVAATFGAAHSTLRAILSHELRCKPWDIIFARDACGKPVLSSIETVPPVHFNLSHSDTSFAIALDRRPIGVDIERRMVSLDMSLLARRTLTVDEYNEWLALEPKERVDKFYWHWTRKEALLKLSGQGMRGDLRKVDTRPSQIAAELKTFELVDITVSVASSPGHQPVFQDITPLLEFGAML